MVVEYIRYRTDDGDTDALLSAYERAAGPLAASAHCLRHEVARGVEDPSAVVVRIEWDSVEGHERGFRSSPEFREFLGEVGPFVPQIEEMRHYEVVGAE